MINEYGASDKAIPAGHGAVDGGEYLRVSHRRVEPYLIPEKY